MLANVPYEQEIRQLPGQDWFPALDPQVAVSEPQVLLHGYYVPVEAVGPQASHQALRRWARSLRLEEYV